MRHKLLFVCESYEQRHIFSFLLEIYESIRHVQGNCFYKSYFHAKINIFTNLGSSQLQTIKMNSILALILLIILFFQICH